MEFYVCPWGSLLSPHSSNTLQCLKTSYVEGQKRNKDLDTKKAFLTPVAHHRSLDAIMRKRPIDPWAHTCSQLSVPPLPSNGPVRLGFLFWVLRKSEDAFSLNSALTIFIDLFQLFVEDY
ncbi:hypothetical protein CDAR_243041 [Caerostris darwini]|uniref:Uncharacterized protein n=1 Tax=Caerostris darwini TaxID=1538125 RepID=A0AAV4SY49_9ARAC|nr:hypothetical protein CDAR_243041 [Caerostris darwini]